jgi:hypothetical protein
MSDLTRSAARSHGLDGSSQMDVDAANDVSLQRGISGRPEAGPDGPSPPLQGPLQVGASARSAGVGDGAPKHQDFIA